MNRKTLYISSILLFLLVGQIKAAWLLIPMDNTQKNHLKAYGIAYWVFCILGIGQGSGDPMAIKLPWRKLSNAIQ